MLDNPRCHEGVVINFNLEKIFAPTFFNSMEHLIVHLLYEARVGRLVQYRWMYLFEMFLHDFKKKIKNKAHDEASIIEAYIVEKIRLFISRYIKPQVTCKRCRPGRNNDISQATVTPRIRGHDVAMPPSPSP
ncbi:UNVERIFIED_CONTAM: hypothetical protein Scaly_1077400 [Sesamum calycinum]|uniref:DUF4218 domain-containing protein n=1 Tax=Sesamum calycinum TaxID=2727403 RepID=A0AAW2QKX8_9LAMI